MMVFEYIRIKKKASSPAPTYVPTPEGCSIISAEGLDFRVRYGTG